MENKKNKLMSLALMLLLLLLIGATYAYFTAQRGSGGSAQIEVGSGTTDSLQFTNGNKINIVANQDNFKKDGENQSDSSIVTATLTPNNTTKEASDMYNVYLVIEDNELVYTTENSEPELVLKVINPASIEITSMDAVKYIDNVGFDITELKPGIYPIVKGYDISANEEPKVDNWEITVTLINLNQDQNKNAGKSFTGKVYITKDDLGENDLIKVNSITSTTTTNTINVDLKIGQEIGKVDKYYFAIEETKESPEDIQTESVASALAKEYEESPTATYAFTTIKEEPLKASQNYKIYGYGIDTKGFRSNIYETIVTTDEYQIPTIESVSHVENENSTTLTVTGQGGTNDISKYQYSIDNNNWIDTSDATGTITISDLDYNKSYEIRIRAVDAEGRYSNIWVENIKIIKLGTEEYPYAIKNVEDLVQLSTEVNGGNPHTGEYYKLENDIDFTGNDNFIPIGNRLAPFKGVFDGYNKNISNLNINVDDLVDNLDASSLNYGLFGNITDGLVKNISISGNIESTKAINAGGIAGAATDTKFINCHNSVNLTSGAYPYSVGGIVGETYNNVEVINCSNDAKIIGGGDAGGLVGWSAENTNVLISQSFNTGEVIDQNNQFAGGLFGYSCDTNNKVEIVDSYNTGKVSAISEEANYVGGLIGSSLGTTVITNSYNNASLETDNDLGNVGGLIGNAGINTVLTNSRNLNTITNGSHVGGLIGYIPTNENAEAIISKSWNEGAITKNKGSVTGSDGGIGGLIGEVGAIKSAIINNSYNKGDITDDLEETNNSIAGGLIGRIRSFYAINNSYNKGKIERIGTIDNIHDQNIGGLVSCSEGPKAIIYNSFNEGKIIGGNRVGGLIANSVSSLIFLNSYNTGDVSSILNGASNVYAGGLLGYAWPNSPINTYLNSYNIGNITSAMHSGGISGYNSQGEVTLNNVYNIGNISGVSGNYAFGNLNLTPNFNNFYYKDGSVSSLDISGNIIQSNEELLNNLNDNVIDEDTLKTASGNSILSEIDSDLTGYKLNKWQMDEAGNPTFIYSND